MMSNDKWPDIDRRQSLELLLSSERLTIREATSADTTSIFQVEAAARSLLYPHGVDLEAIEIPVGFEESISWDVALVAEIQGTVVGSVRSSDLGAGWLALDQLSVDPAYAQRGIGRRLLVALADRARELGYLTITGTTFRAVPFNAPFYADLDAAEDLTPHPVMVERRRVEQELGLDSFGPRLVMRVTIGR